MSQLVDIKLSNIKCWTSFGKSYIIIKYCCLHKMQ